MNLLKKLWNSLLKQDNDYYEYTTLDTELFKAQCENCKKIDNIDQSILYAKGIIDTIDQNATKGIQDRYFANPDGTSKNMILCADCYSAWFAGNDPLWHEEFEARENININSRESGITHSLNLNKGVVK